MLYGEENHGYKNATRRVAGKKIKGRGGKKIKSDSRIYTPATTTTATTTTVVKVLDGQRYMCLAKEGSD